MEVITQFYSGKSRRNLAASFQLSSPRETGQTAPNSPSKENVCAYRVLSYIQLPGALASSVFTGSQPRSMDTQGAKHTQSPVPPEVKFK